MRRAVRIGGIVLLLAGLIAACLIVMGLSEAVDTPIRRETRVELPGMRSDLAPYRVALMSDIHFGNRAMPRERLDAIVEQVNAARPDLVVIVGDFVNGYRDDERGLGQLDDLAAGLANLRARDGVIATLGNHEFWTDPALVQIKLESKGIRVARNQALQAGPLIVLGLDDPFTSNANIAAALATGSDMQGVPVAIAHSPDIAPDLPAAVPLVLAGHTHCGQLVLPVLGPLINWSPYAGKPVYDPRFRCGIVRDGGRTTIVTAGLGSGTIPIRIGAPPDWWLVTLSAPKDR